MAKSSPLSIFRDGFSAESRGSKTELAIAADALNSELYFAILGARQSLLTSEPEAVKLAEQPAFQTQNIAATAVAETLATVTDIRDAPSYVVPSKEVVATATEDQSEIKRLQAAVAGVYDEIAG